MKKIKQIFTIIVMELLVVNSISLSSFANGADDDIWNVDILDIGHTERMKVDSSYQAILTDFENMTIMELNNYITQCRISMVPSKGIYSPQAQVSDLGIIKEAWLAAAAIARKQGYECSATLVEHSIMGLDYTESGKGLFARKIITASSFVSLMNRISNIPYHKTSSSFEKADNKDLFYAIHNYDIEMMKTGVGYRVILTDIFDFKKEDYDGSIFTSTVNNWAYLCQCAYVLKKINVRISFDY